MLFDYLKDQVGLLMIKHFLDTVIYHTKGSYSYIPLPKQMRGVISLKNKDNECF